MVREYDSHRHDNRHEPAWITSCRGGRSRRPAGAARRLRGAKPAHEPNSGSWRGRSSQARQHPANLRSAGGRSEARLRERRPAIRGRLGDIIAARRPLADYDQLLKDWAGNGGDQIRKELGEALAAAGR
jgi:hypothetical protein